MSTEIADGLAGGGSGEVDIIKIITEPFVDLIIQINGTVLDEWAVGNCHDCELQKRHCPEFDSPDKCKYLFNLVTWEDWIVGTILAVMALVMLCTCLIFMVKLLQSLLQGAIAITVKKVLNPDFKYAAVNYLWGYVLIAIGAGLTFCVQSSSVFTSTLTPLVGIGLLEVETVYPLFLGSNIGTTSTGLLAALATTGTAQNLADALTVSFVHLFFNVFGILIFYPFKFMR